MAAKDADTISIAPLRRLFLELDGELVERDVEQMKFLLRGEQLKVESVKVIPLCYPDNYVWKRSKGVLEKKSKRRGKLVVCEDAIDFLRSIEGPICPIVVTGPHRNGKSYIASQLIEPRPFDCVFQTSSKMQPQTTGIWMSTDVFKKKMKNKAEMSVVIMDTEGLGAYNAYSQDDLQLFSLMALLSSVLVYNSRGSLTSEDIKQLSWVSTLGDMIHGKGMERHRNVERTTLSDFPELHVATP
ncbi:guanylate-binding protein 4-like [Ptychodera flava]|uniref:guanylate-binding protein 4-like n=1 Tax=Ptychodera flava TaxID=63121 RepID=UPI00396A6192